MTAQSRRYFRHSASINWESGHWVMDSCHFAIARETLQSTNHTAGGTIKHVSVSKAQEWMAADTAQSVTTELDRIW